MAVQFDLSHYYRQSEGTQELSPTLQSSELWTPQQTPQRPTVSSERYHEYRSATPSASRLPWGREREYGGIGAVSLPLDHRPKTEPPPLEAKGHKHYGYGGDPWPRGLPIQQFYNLTKLKKSAVRESDDLYPKPPAASISGRQMQSDFPVEHPYHSHISKFAVFPSFRPSEERARSSTPLHPQTPACGLPTFVLKKTKGNPYRHEVISVPSGSQKEALTWPGQQGYYHMPKFHYEKDQIYYPSPPKTVAPNPLYKSYEETPSDRTTNLQRNLIKSQWLTTYNRSFTDRGEMNPVQLDDYYEKVIGNITGRTDENTELKPTFVSTILSARPLEGRIARLRDGRRALVSEEVSENDIAEYNPNTNEEIDKAVCPPCVSDPAGDTADSCHATKVNSEHLSTNWEHKEPDIRKITDTEKTDALYRRQLTPFPVRYELDSMPGHEENLQPNGQELVMLKEKVSGHTNPFLKNPLASQEATSIKPLHNHNVVGSYNNKHTLRTQGTIYDCGKTLPRATLLDLQDSFSRSEAHQTFHHTFPEKTKDLRDNCFSGRKHAFYGFNSFYFHN
ncbi:sperm-associated microtubule inner protein 4 [Hyperolius riggenbachi]|uniref:sperm-associated microtubule inner protein 4 n=1 Tax=Hyperolius riggenbachi TaxID=752182 RepID=UPI0035A2A171